MASEPLILAWKLEVESQEFLGGLRSALRSLTEVDATLIDETVFIRGRQEVSSTNEYRFNNFFKRWGVLPPTGNDPASIRLFFHRNLEAGRFWKDLMASVLRKARQFEHPVWVALDYSVTDKEVYLAADQIPLWANRLGGESQTFWSVCSSYLLNNSFFTFRDLEAYSGIPEASLKAMHRNSYRAIRREQSLNPLWSKWDHNEERYFYSMEPAVRDEFLSVTGGVWHGR